MMSSGMVVELSKKMPEIGSKVRIQYPNPTCSDFIDVSAES
jgi:hypothetical protein